MHDPEMIVFMDEIVEMMGTNVVWWNTVCIVRRKWWFTS